MATKKLNQKEQKIADEMKVLGVYKPEFDESIRRYVKISDEYRTIYGEYKKNRYPFAVVGPQGAKKSPMFQVLESLRKDLIALEDALGLNPRGLMKLQEEPFKAERATRRADRLI